MKFKPNSRSDDFKGFLDEGTSLTGELVFSGTFRVDGNVHGSIQTSDMLVVGERASIHADIKAGELEVHGAVSGNIDGSRRVQIFSTGRVRGGIRTPRLIVEAGGRLDGQSRGSREDSEDISTQDSESEPNRIQNE